MLAARKLTLMDNSHALSVTEVLENFDVSAEKGLSKQQIERATEQYGLNGMLTSLCQFFSCRTSSRRGQASLEVGS